MDFYPNQLFHIYNQGNNNRQTFFNDDNYEYFIWKMRTYLPPFGDFISYCLMPNHFHWQFFVRKTEIERRVFWEHVDRVEYIRRVKKYAVNARAVDKTSDRVANLSSMITLNEAIGILEKSYTSAINTKNRWTGSLFRKGCNAKDGWIDDLITVTKANKKLDYRFLPGTDYAYQCLCYIHKNPVKAHIVKKETDWKFSSAKDYAGLRKGTLCNLELGRSIMDFM